ESGQGNRQQSPAALPPRFMNEARHVRPQMTSSPQRAAGFIAVESAPNQAGAKKRAVVAPGAPRDRTEILCRLSARFARWFPLRRTAKISFLRQSRRFIRKKGCQGMPGM